MAGCLLVLALVLAGAAPSFAQDMGVITGSEKGTYYQFGLDLQKLVKPTGVNLSVHPSKGSVENIFAVYQRPGVQMGIVQSDVLAFVARLQNDPVLARIAKKTKMVFPLYNEEVHLIGKRGIAEFDDLAGRRVAVGREGSGTYLTARLLFKLSEVAPREMVLIDTQEALTELKAGRIDAMFYVAGYPVRLLKAVLISFDFRRRDCDSVGKVAQLIASRQEWLQKNGHPKWKSVDLNYPLRGWEQYDCVRKALGKPAASAAATRTRTGQNPVFDAIKGVLDD
jgi:TRAP transporter TAXI family solute receptor